VKKPAILALIASMAVAASAQSAAPTSAPPAAPPAATPYRFAFSYVKGDKFRVLSTVDESVYINHRLAYSTQILNRIAYEIADAAADRSSSRCPKTRLATS